MSTKTETSHDRLPKGLHRHCEDRDIEYQPQWLTDQMLIERAQTAKRLTKILGGKMRVKYEPTSQRSGDDDEETLGHIFGVELPHIDEWPAAFIVDDLEGVEQAIIGSLTSASKFYRDLAKAVSKSLKNGGGK